MSEKNKGDKSLRQEAVNNGGNTLSALFALMGVIALSVGLMMLFINQNYMIIRQETQLGLWYGAMIFTFISLVFNIVSMVFSSKEFANHIISRDRLFIHISLLIFSFFMFLAATA
jgi:hypothetical protein